MTSDLLRALRSELLPPIKDFRQRKPYEGQPATKKTEVRILYTRHAVSFGIHCFDSEPGRIHRCRVASRRFCFWPIYLPTAGSSVTWFMPCLAAESFTGRAAGLA
jgi:hypothetical protein